MATPFWAVDTLFCCVIKPKNSANFLYYVCLMVDWMFYNEASGVPSLNVRIIESAEVKCPTSKERTAIAKVLCDMDTEFTALETRRTETRALKQEMMQELLTGRTRRVGPYAKPRVRGAR